MVVVQTLIDESAKLEIVIRAECLAVFAAQVGANRVTIPDSKVTVDQRWYAMLWIDLQERGC